MSSKNFLLVSLEESKAKQLAQIVSNDVCRRILDFLSAKEKGATETEISADLGIALSTAHYNMKQLVESGIVKAEEFHYSPKGREVLHYTLANKYIIIAPKATATESLANKLKRILPVVAVVAAAGAVVQIYSTLRASFGSAFSESVARATTISNYGAQKAADIAVPAAQEAAKQSVGSAIASSGMHALANKSATEAAASSAGNETTTVVIERVITQTVQSEQNIALWFLAGALVAIVTYIVIDNIRKR